MLMNAFAKKTSILYDIKTMTDLLSADSTDEDEKNLLSHLICASIRFMKGATIRGLSKDMAILQKYWELALSSLPLVKLNVEVKSNKHNQQIVAPLLKAAVAMGK